MATKYTLQEIRVLIREDGGLFDELDRINKALYEFLFSMRDEMFDHAADGCSGWDSQECENEKHFMKELLGHIEKGKFIGAANFCMMLNQYPVKGE